MLQYICSKEHILIIVSKCSHGYNNHPLTNKDQTLVCSSYYILMRLLYGRLKEPLLAASRLQIRHLVTLLPALLAVALVANETRSLIINRSFSSGVIRVLKICD